MTVSADIVVTTIHEPAWLSGYLENLRRFERASSARITIIADQKTPPGVFQAAAEAQREGFNIWCPSLEDQSRYLQRLGAPADLIPWNTDNRRNIGFLSALERQADVLISIDDDNYCSAGEDFVGAHLAVGRPPRSDHQVANRGKWINICDRMECVPAVPVFPRGFPYAARKQPLATLGALGTEASTRPVSVNAGLWLDDPDVDAVSRLGIAPRAVSAKSGAILLAPETWSPINSQNTAVTKAAIPAYYYVRMGWAMGGLRLDRFGDILSGYFVQKCAKHLGDHIRIGTPVAVHRRTSHDLLKDLYAELGGILLVEELLPWLQDLRIPGTSYRDCYEALADALTADAHRFKGLIWDDGGREFLVETASCMRAWLLLTDTILGQP